MIRWVTILAMFPLMANAEFVTVLGVGLKANNFSSAILDPECDQVFMPARGNRGWSSCGGNNPIFVGWPIAYDFGNWRVGWFHFSSFFDGGNSIGSVGDEHEVHMNCFCATYTVRWTR